MVFKFKKPVLRIFFGDGVVVGDTKVFKPGAVHTVGGLELHGSIGVQEYRGIGGKQIWISQKKTSFLTPSLTGKLERTYEWNSDITRTRANTDYYNNVSPGMRLAARRSITQ